jgi:hypothetical protein
VFEQEITAVKSADRKSDNHPVIFEGSVFLIDKGDQLRLDELREGRGSARAMTMDFRLRSRIVHSPGIIVVLIGVIGNADQEHRRDIFVLNESPGDISDTAEIVLRVQNIDDRIALA